MPEVAESTVSISEGKFSPSGKDTRQTDEGWEKVLFPGPLPTSATVPPLPESESYYFDSGFCNFAFGFAQNARV